MGCSRPTEKGVPTSGLRKIGWQTLRHSFASHLAMRGVPLKAIQQLMGHSTIEMTMRYAHLSPDVRKDPVRLLDRGSYGNLTATEAVLAANPGKRAAALSHGIGAQAQRALAIVMIGGSLQLAILTRLLQFPLRVLAYRWLERRKRGSASLARS